MIYSVCKKKDHKWQPLTIHEGKRKNGVIHWTEKAAGKKCSVCGYNIWTPKKKKSVKEPI